MKYRELERELPNALIYYAVKANPAKEVLSVLNSLGSYFDAASIQEIELCVELGISVNRLAYGNTIKKARDIARANALGIDLFAFDSRAELQKLKTEAPGSRVYCRLFMSGSGADWPLSRKFGCSPVLARELIEEASAGGLKPVGISFHVGSQQRDLSQWSKGIDKVAEVFEQLNSGGIVLEMINIGGGFPAQYRQRIDKLDVYAATVRESMSRHFGNNPPTLLIEPGRAITGDAGIIQTEVVLIAEKSRELNRRWVFLDIGKFGGLPETYEESIQYRLRTPHDGAPEGPVVIAGPTCDEIDVLYETSDYFLPLALKEGDKIEIMSAGAYTATYSSIGFNGFPPLRQYYI
tara:strand:- start:909 stop:1958 length:1050 start_codon:yes stop_codon:yes gene_type:complete